MHQNLILLLIYFLKFCIYEVLENTTGSPPPMKILFGVAKCQLCLLVAAWWLRSISSLCHNSTQKYMQITRYLAAPGNGPPLAPVPAEAPAKPSPDMPYVSYCFRFMSSPRTYTSKPAFHISSQVNTNKVNKMLSTRFLLESCKPHFGITMWSHDGQDVNICIWTTT